jgi:hypothetical protein
MAILEGIFKGALRATENIGKAAMNIGEFGYRYMLKPETLSSWEPLRREGTGKALSGIFEFAGKTTIRGAKAAGRMANNVTAGTIARSGDVATNVVGKTLGLADRYGKAALGVSDAVGSVLTNPKLGIFVNDIKNGAVVKDFNNLWTGKKLNPIVGGGLVIGGAALGVASGMSGTDPANNLGPESQSEIPALATDGNSFNRFANSAGGDLTLSLHNLRRG